MMDKKELFYEKKSAFDGLTDEERALSDAYAEEYKAFLDHGKTEREAVQYAVTLLEKAGFQAYVPGQPLPAGTKVYRTVRDKAVFAAVMGTAPLSQGTNICGAHLDAPRLDLKQVPLYEDSELAFFKTHYYGGIKAYQWVTTPLAFHGTVIRRDGTAVEISMGEDPGDPVFFVSDLLPHLAKDQMKKTLGEAFTGENLNILIGSSPSGPEKETDRVKLTVMRILNERYGMVEEDFLSAELSAVPAMNARDVGFDRTMIGAYGQDDRSCSFAALRGIMDIATPEKTAVCLLVDKEEIGSEGVTGMQSLAFEDFMADLCDTQGVKLRTCFANSFCLSGDVCNAFDPNFPEVSEKRNAARLGCGVAICKYTGSRGKSGSSDASAETIYKIRRVFAEKGVTWQMAELGKVDQGGGGTIAKYMANRNIDTVDAGVPVISMHAPYEVVSKLDCYMTYKGIRGIYEDR